MKDPEIRTTDMGIEYGYLDEGHPVDRRTFGTSEKGCLELLLVLWLPAIITIILEVTQHG